MPLIYGKLKKTRKNQKKEQKKKQKRKKKKKKKAETEVIKTMEKSPLDDEKLKNIL